MFWNIDDEHHKTVLRFNIYIFHIFIIIIPYFCCVHPTKIEAV